MTKLSESAIFGAFVFVAVFLGTVVGTYVTSSKPNNVSKFNVTEDAIAKDLDGRALSLAMGQVWPFDSSQNITVKIDKKKPLDEYVVIVAEVNAVAPVQQETSSAPKEQFSTNPSGKDTPKTPAKLPSKLHLRGMVKLTYELFDNNWYLISAENLSLKAFPID
jgi:hypothetical protein